jgi:glucose-1-phosphate cytidylyltransferase
MKTVILCGGLGTRISEETGVRPKPMIEVNNKPILWHLMKCYEQYGFTDFTLALGYKAEFIKDYFMNYHLRASDMTVNLGTGQIDVKNPGRENWSVDLIDTGGNTMTGGRVLRLKDHIEPTGTFFLTYGDGLCNINLKTLLDFHKSHGKIATVTAVRPTARFGELLLDGDSVQKFEEKPQSSQGWINGGFFVFEPEIFNYIDDDSTILEKSPLERISAEGQLQAFKHDGFWQCMDTMRDKILLEKLALENPAPWLRR